MVRAKARTAVAAALLSSALGSCATDATSSEATPDPNGVPVEPDDFDPAGLAIDIEIVDCTLSNGQPSTCYEIVINGAPSDHDPGPFCPRNISDGPEVSGTWIESGQRYDADGAFIEQLADFYDDPTWQLFDPATGEISVTDTLDASTARSPGSSTRGVDLRAEVLQSDPKTPSARHPPNRAGHHNAEHIVQRSFEPRNPGGALTANRDGAEV